MSSEVQRVTIDRIAIVAPTVARNLYLDPSCYIICLQVNFQTLPDLLRKKNSKIYFFFIGFI